MLPFNFIQIHGPSLKLKYVIMLDAKIIDENVWFK
jgi:hypothetical protein